MEFVADPLKNVVIRAQNRENPNSHMSKIRHLLPVYGFRNIGSACKIWRNPLRVMDVILPQCTNRNQIRKLHISKIRFLFPVSLTIEYKVGIGEFYLHMGFGADLLKNVVTRA